MKVLQINSVCGYGSTGKIAVDLYKTLEQNGDECMIAYGRGTAPENINTIKIGNKLDNYWQVFLTRIFDKHDYGSKIATKKLIKKIENYNPDIIHLHNIHGYYINLKILFNYLENAKKPVVWTLHDCWSFTGHCSHFDYIGCEKWKTKCHKCPQKGNYPKSILLDNSTSNYELKKEIIGKINNLTFVTPSKWLERIARKSFLQNRLIKTIHNGIDLNTFKPIQGNLKEKYNIEKNKKVILGVTNNWSDRKGLTTFIELVDKLDNSYQIVLVGISNKEKIPSSIRAISRTNNVQELVELYSLSDVLVNPTLEDTFPTINLEALACGTPIITYKTGGSPEAIDETCGVVVEKGNIEELIKQIKKVKNKNEDIIEQCVKRSKIFDKNECYKKYIELYNEIYNKEQ